MMMIAALTQLLVLQLVGEVIARTLALPIPGPVIGMALLFAALALRGGPSPTCAIPRKVCCSICRCFSCRPAPGSCCITSACPMNGCRWRFRCC
jgi:hypothetical protein